MLRKLTPTLIMLTLVLVGFAAAELRTAEWYPKFNDYVFVCGDGTAEAYNWRFGDDEKLLGVSNGDVFHTFEMTGIYNVVCEAISGGEVVQTHEMEVKVDTVLSEEAPQEDSVNATASNKTGGTSDDDNTTIQRQVSLSVDPSFPQGDDYVFRCTVEGFEPLAYTWRFGDGEQLMRLDLPDVWHTYHVSGEREVTCTAYGDGFALSDSLTVDLGGEPADDTSLSIGVNPLTDIYDVELTCDTQGFAPTNYSWEFGDGENLTSNTSRIVHIYPGLGPFETSCTAGDGNTTETVTTTVRPRGPEGQLVAEVVIDELTEDYNYVLRCEAEGLEPTQYNWWVSDRDRTATRNATRMVDGETVEGNSILHTFLSHSGIHFASCSATDGQVTVESPQKTLEAVPKGSENPAMFNHPALQTTVGVTRTGDFEYTFVCEPHGFRWLDEPAVRWDINLHNGTEQLHDSVSTNSSNLNYTFEQEGTSQVSCSTTAPPQYTHEYYEDVAESPFQYSTPNPTISEAFEVKAATTPSAEQCLLDETPTAPHGEWVYDRVDGEDRVLTWYNAPEQRHILLEAGADGTLKVLGGYDGSLPGPTATEDVWLCLGDACVNPEGQRETTVDSSCPTTGEPEVSLELAPGYPHHHNVLTLCKTTGFDPVNYTFAYGDGTEETTTHTAGFSFFEGWHSYNTTGSHTVSCTATDGNTTLTDGLTVNISTPVETSLLTGGGGNWYYDNGSIGVHAISWDRWQLWGAKLEVESKDNLTATLRCSDYGTPIRDEAPRWYIPDGVTVETLEGSFVADVTADSPGEYEITCATGTADPLRTAVAYDTPGDRMFRMGLPVGQSSHAPTVTVGLGE